MTQEAFDSRFQLIHKLVMVCHKQLSEMISQGRNRLTDDEIASISGSCFARYHDENGNEQIEFASSETVRKLTDSILATGITSVGKVIREGKLTALVNNLMYAGPDGLDLMNRLSDPKSVATTFGTW